MDFYQAQPELGNSYEADGVLRRYLRRVLPREVLAAIEPDLRRLGELAGGELYRAHLEARRDEPRLEAWDAWGKRTDRIHLTPLWRRAKEIAAEFGILANAYERPYGAASRIHQHALVYLVDPSWHVYSCPLAMTDGAARTLLSSQNRALTDRALPRLTSRDPDFAWTSGQWMTERTGGSDVAITETVARPGPDGDFLLHGTKWFSSATTSEMALTLARPEGNPAGGAGLALFYVEVRRPDGTMNGIHVNRLKDKLGTRMVPTAELTLDGTRATPVMGLTGGIKNITPMLGITRTWNAVAAASGMRRAVALAKDYATRRVAFGAALAEKPLHVDTLAWMEAEAQGAFQLAFRVVELGGKEDQGSLDEDEGALLRLLTPIAKLTTAKQAVAVASEALEAFGGAGYVEDTGLPRLLRDAQVLPIWEGTTNVLALDVLRALAKTGFSPIVREVARALGGAPLPAIERALARAMAWLEHPRENDARRFALTVGRTLEAALLVAEGRLSGDPQPWAAARRLVAGGIDLLGDPACPLEADARLLAQA